MDIASIKTLNRLSILVTGSTKYLTILLLIMSKRLNKSESKFKMILTILVTLLFIGYGMAKYH